MMEPLLSNIHALIDDFTYKTGDSPTHILVTQNQWIELNHPKTYEHSVSCCLDYLVVQPVGDYHYPQFPMVVQLPPFTRHKTLCSVGKYKVICET